MASNSLGTGGGGGGADLDSILDSALDELEEQDRMHTAAEDVPEVGSQVASPSLEDIHRMMEQLAEGGEHSESLLQTLRNYSGTAEGMNTVNSLMAQLMGANKSDGEGDHFDAHAVDRGDVDRTIAATLQMLAGSAKDMEGVEASHVEDMGEQVMNDMMNELEQLGEKEDYGQVVDSLMQQLLSKELMYEPMKAVCERFPEWLALQKEHMSAEEYSKYGLQYQCFQRIVATYESEPDNIPRLMELMFDVQQYGQPPADIVRDLAPGLQFDEHGMPIMPNVPAEMGAGGTLPNMAELAALAGDNPNCTIN